MSIPNLSSTTVTKANKIDISALAEINTYSYLPEAICPFFFSNSDWPNPAPFISYFTMRAENNFQDSDTETYKIVDAQSKEILGFVCVGISEGKERHGGPSNPGGNFEPPPGFNLEFGMTTAKGLAELEGCMKGTKYLFLTSFAVHPKYQGRGLGSKLLQHCAEIADAAGLPTYLNAFPGAHSLYKKFGFADVGHYDVDLNEYGVKFRGFGIYRTYGMLRQPVPRVKT